MKRHYKLLPLISLMIATPIVASLSSCTGIHSGTYQITLNSLKNQTPIKKLKHGPSLKSLLYGNKHFHKGNYVLFLSSQSAPGINKMLFGSSSTIFENKNAKIGENQNATLTAEVLQNINAQISSS
jgi:hypothetical protein